MEPLQIRGMHFYEGEAKWLARGVTYGPFEPRPGDDRYPDAKQLRADFKAISEIGANAVRLYTVPKEHLAAIAAEYSLRLLIDIPWPKHLDVYRDPRGQETCLEMVRDGVGRVGSWPNLLGVNLGNEAPADLIRWAGAGRAAAFLRRMRDCAKEIAPDVPFGYANYPSTEYLPLGCFDFLGFNVYLEAPQTFHDYLARLRQLVPDKPLLLSEFGADSISHGEQGQRAILESNLSQAYQAGLSGAFVFAWTDEWHTGGWSIEDWSFGIVDRERRPKPALEAVASTFRGAPSCGGLESWPAISVVVATYNGGRTLRRCLESLQALKYPDFEIVVVDDGSADNTQAILRDFSGLEVVRQHNLGLSCARNAGIEAARGEIVAFTDSDCFADPDWLLHLAADIEREGAAGAGGPNLTPAEPGVLARCVGLAPGHASHVLLNPREAEHVPGCNMAFRKSVLADLGGFDPQFRKAGDDVDIAWRLLETGGRIVFSPGAFVWHHRRQTPRAYWKQQMGYGEAEALLMRKHPHRFTEGGLSIWRGRIYGRRETQPLLGGPNIRYGVFGAGAFQCVYEREGSYLYHLIVSAEWWALSLALTLAGFWAAPALALGGACAALSLAASGLQAWRKCGEEGSQRAEHFFSVWGLWVTQPLARGLARYWTRFRTAEPAAEFREALRDSELKGKPRSGASSVSEYWSDSGAGRLPVLGEIVKRMGALRWLYTTNSEWEPWDLSVAVSWWFRTRILSAEENHGGRKRLLRLRFRLSPTSMFYGFGAGVLVLSAMVALRDTVAARGILVVWLGISWLLFRQGLRGRLLVEHLADAAVREMGYARMGKDLDGPSAFGADPANSVSRSEEDKDRKEAGSRDS